MFELIEWKTSEAPDSNTEQPRAEAENDNFEDGSAATDPEETEVLILKACTGEILRMCVTLRIPVASIIVRLLSSSSMVHVTAQIQESNKAQCFSA